MHESTVSRVTNEKFVQTPRGVLPLDAFARCWVQEGALWQAVQAALPADRQRRVREINDELTALTQAFERRIREDR